MNTILKQNTAPARQIFRWSPRVLGMLFSLVFAFYAFDVFKNNASLEQNLLDFAVHLIPASIIAAITILAWWKPLPGGIIFTMLALAYIYTSIAHLQWVLIIGAPLLVLGALFVAAHFAERRHKTTPGKKIKA